MRGKKGATDFVQLVLVIAVVIMVANVVRPGLFAGADVDGVPVTQKVEVITDKACGSTTMTMDFQEKHNEGTSMTSYNGTVFVNGAKKGIFSEGGTFTAQGGDELNVYYALDPASANYYAAHASGAIPCTGQTAAFMTSAILGKGSLAGALQDPPEKVYKSQTATTTTCYNKKTLTGLTTTALAIGLGGTETARCYIDWKYEEGYGVVAGNTLACRFTDKYIDQADLVASIGGAALGTPATYVPSSTRFAGKSSNHTMKYWNFPAIDGKTTTTTTLDIAIKGDDTNNADGSVNFSCEVIDTDLFELDAGGVAVGVEDSDDNSNVGRTTEVIIDIPIS